MLRFALKKDQERDTLGAQSAKTLGFGSGPDLALCEFKPR